MRSKSIINFSWGFKIVLFFLFSVFYQTSFVIAAEEVTDSIQTNASRSFYNTRTGDYSFSVSLRNVSTNEIHAPLTVVITNISSSQVTVANPDGTDPSGNPYFDYSGLLGGDSVLSPGESSTSKRWVFHNPRNVRFRYTVKILGEVGNQDNIPPTLKITNPVDNSSLGSLTPLITISFYDDGSGIDTNSFNASLDGTDISNNFQLTASRATYRLENQLALGAHVLTVSIADSAGNISTKASHFTVVQSSRQVKYIFSISDNDWIFASAGDGIYTEYLSPEQIGLGEVSDITGLSKLLLGGSIYFSMKNYGGILSSLGDGRNIVYLENSQIGLGTSDRVESEHIDFDGSALFSIKGVPNIFWSIGDGTNILYKSNTDLGISEDVRIGCLHIDYDSTIYFCRSDESGIYRSTGDGTSSQFLTPADLGVPGATIDAFGFLPETNPPTIGINPVDGAFINTTTPNISISFFDTESGIDTSTFYCEINGIDMTNAFSVTNSGATYQVPDNSPLSVGANTIYVRIRDRVGNEASANSNFRVGILRAIPGANPTSGLAPLTVHFTTDGEDPAGTIEVFRWDFDGDGRWDTYDTVARDYDHTYNHSGTYTAVLYVQSSTGATATANITITVGNNPPTATADIRPSNGQVPLTAQFFGSGSDSDGHIVLYEWDFDGDGTFDWSSTTNGNTSHTYTEIGTYHAVFRVTDNEGATATAVAMTSVVSVGPEGSPTAQGSATPDTGPAPLTVQFSGTGTDPDGTIVQYEWDFENDGVFDWSSNSNGSTTHTYTTPGTYIAAFRVTDNDGKTGVDYVLIDVGIQVSLTVSDQDRTFNPYSGETLKIVTSINAPIPANVVIRNSDGETVRTIPLDTSLPNPVVVFWDGKDDNNIPVPDGIYYAILRYQYNGSWHEYDLSNTGGQRFVPSRKSTGGSSWSPALSRPFEDKFLPIHFSLNRAAEVTLFVGILWNTNTRIRTIYNRVPMPAGQHTVYWDGLDDAGNVAQPPPGNYLILGIWGYTLPDNAMYLTGGRPEISNVAATPNYFCPFSEKCDAQGNDEGILLSYNLSEDAVSVELRVYSIETGYLVRTEVINNVSAGDNVFFWDGKNNNGEYVDMGDYQVGLIATDGEGNKSMLSYTLVRINY